VTNISRSECFIFWQQ